MPILRDEPSTLSESKHSGDERSHVEDQSGTPPPSRNEGGSLHRTPHLPGFNHIRSHVGRFSGRRGDEDFGLWLADYKEATTDFNWSNEQRAKWFSWFVEGPAKATWQQVSYSNGTTISPALKERSIEKCVLQIVLAQGIHLKPKQTKWAKVTVSGSVPYAYRCGIATPSSEVLASDQRL